MPQVDVAIIKLEKAFVHDLRNKDYVRYYHKEPYGIVENNPILRMASYDGAIEVEALRIREFCKVTNGHETRKFLAIHPKVYEELYSLSDSELSEEVLNNHKSQLESQLRNHNYIVDRLNRAIEKRDSKIQSLESATFFTRFKWLLTGVAHENN